MFLFNDDTVERTLDEAQGPIQGNRLRVYTSKGEIPVKRLWLRGRYAVRSAGKRVCLTRLWGHVVPLVKCPEFQPFLFWLECRSHVVFATAHLKQLGLFDAPRLLEGKPIFWFETTGPLFQTPVNVDPVCVLGWERALAQAGCDVQMTLAYEHWLVTHAPHWDRLMAVRETLAQLLLKPRDK